MRTRMFKPGDPVIFRKSKLSTRPGPRAEEIHPAPRGETYSYEVDKFWVVVETREDGTVVVETRRGKQHVIDANHPRLRHINLWERLFYRSRFPRVKRESVTG